MGQAGHFRHFQWGAGHLLQLQMLLLHFPSYLFLVLKALERKAPLNRFYIKNIAQAIIVAAAADAAADGDAATARINGS